MYMHVILKRNTMLFDFKTLIIFIPFFFSISALKIIIERVFLFGWHVFVSLSIIFYDIIKIKTIAFTSKV